MSKLDDRARIDLGDLGIGELLALSRRILAELRRRGVIRSGNAPAGDYAELLVQRATTGELAPNSQRSWDVVTSDGERLPVKARVVTDPRVHGERQLSVFRSWDFDAAVVVLFDDEFRVWRAARLPVETLQAAARFVQHVSGYRVLATDGLLAAGDAMKPEPKRPMKPTRVTKTVKVTIAGVDVGTIPALEPQHASEAKVMAEKVYPTVYIFENSVRDLVERVLQAQFGANWWTTAIPATVQKTAAKHKADEKNDPWHGRRGTREIDYVFLVDLWAIIKHQWKHFKALFPNQAWVETLITNDMNVSRRPLAHMNPLSVDDVTNVEVAFRKWVKQLRAVENLIP